VSPASSQGKGTAWKATFLTSPLPGFNSALLSVLFLKVREGAALGTLGPHFCHPFHLLVLAGISSDWSREVEPNLSPMATRKRVSSVSSLISQEKQETVESEVLHL
jgi:hypothetical protein